MNRDASDPMRNAEARIPEIRSVFFREHVRKKEKILLLCIMKTPYSVLLYSMHERKKISFFSYAANAWSVDSRKTWLALAETTAFMSK